MQTDLTDPINSGVDPEELARHIAEMYRDVANEVERDLHFPTGRPLAETLGYPAELWAACIAGASISLLALAPIRSSRHVSRPDLGDGADVARAASEEGFTNTNTTQEVSK